MMLLSLIEDSTNLIEDVVQSSGMCMYSVPFGAPASQGEVTDFSTFGIDSPGEAFRLGWSVTMAEGSDARLALAFVAGSITYQPGVLGTPGTLTLTNYDALGTFVRQNELPDWFPFPYYVVYSNIDQGETTSVMREYLETNPAIAETLYEGNGVTTLDELVLAFSEGRLTWGIPVPAGQVIGVAASSGIGVRQLDLSMQTQDGALSGIYLDPAIYHVHMEEAFLNLSGHILVDSLQKVFAGPAANGVVRYVSIGGSTSGDFTDPASPADLVSTALGVCNPYDTIVIADSGVYQEAEEIQIFIPVTITSLSTAVATNTSTPDFPILRGTGAVGSNQTQYRIVYIYNVSDGIVTLNSLAITEGSANYEGIIHDILFEGIIPNSGGGILIYRSHQTYIRNCYIYDNAAIYDGPGAIPLEEPGDEIFMHEQGFGGGIHAYHSSAYIYRNRISDNWSTDRGGGVGVWGYGWPTIEGNVISGNSATRRRPDGGGIGMEIAIPSDLLPIPDFFIPEWGWDAGELDMAKTRAVTVKRNIITGNTAVDDGGGVYLSVLSQARFVENEIASNVAGQAGGGVRSSFGSHLTMSGDSISGNIANTSHGENGGGGIAVRDGSVRMSKVRIEANTVEGFTGGGLFYSSSDEGQVVTGFTDYHLPWTDFNTILRNVFDISQVNLEILGNSSITDNYCSMIEGELDHRKGGGLYALRYWDEDAFGFEFEALPFTVVIEQFSAIAGNHIDEVIGPNQTYSDPLGVTFPDSQEFHLEDMVDRNQNPVDASNAQSFMAGDLFEYP